MPLTPQITLTITLDDYSGNEIGSSGSPAYVRVALCGYGPILPCIPGTAMVAKVASWPGDIPYIGSPITLLLWGNDVISPATTYYTISILDAKNNVLQTAAYVFTGTVSADLSTISPSFPPPVVVPVVEYELVTIPFSSMPIFDCLLVQGPITFDLTLTGNVVFSTLQSPSPGQIVTFIISQDVNGGWTFVWPSNVKNPGIINSPANSITTQSFVARANGNVYPIGPQTYS